MVHCSEIFEGIHIAADLLRRIFKCLRLFAARVVAVQISGQDRGVAAGIEQIVHAVLCTGSRSCFLCDAGAGLQGAEADALFGQLLPLLRFRDRNAELREAYFTPAAADMVNDGFLGVSVIVLALLIWLGILFVSDPRRLLKKPLRKAGN